MIMANSNSNSSGSSGENSGSSHSTGHGSDFYDLVGFDRKTATKAVAIVLRASRRGYVDLCTEFASLLSEKKRLELERNTLKLTKGRSESTQISEPSHGTKHCCSCSSNESGSGRSWSTKTRSTQTKPLMEITTIPSTTSSEACVSADVVTPSVEQKLPDMNYNLHNKVRTTEGELQKAKQQISRLESKLFSIKAENQALKAQINHSLLSSKDGQLGVNGNHSKVIHVKSIKAKDIKSEPLLVQERPIIKGTFNTNDKAQSLQFNILKEDEIPESEHGCVLKSCVKHRVENCLKSSPSFKIHPKMPSIEIPTFHGAENTPPSATNTLTPVQPYASQQGHDRKPNELMPKVLPKVGDFVFVQGEIKGSARYIGPIKGGTLTYVGIHLNSPVGNNNGTVDGIKYFTCPPNYGAFIPLKDITNFVPKVSKTSSKETLTINSMPFSSRNDVKNMRTSGLERSVRTPSPPAKVKEEKRSVKTAA